LSQGAQCAASRTLPEGKKNQNHYPRDSSADWFMEPASVPSRTSRKLS
jgi:hypothetical protein